MLEPILVGDNDAYKRKIARRDAQGGAEGAHLRSTARDSSAGWLPKLTVWRLWGAYLDIVCCGIVASDERTLWGRGDGVYGPTFERRCVCLDVCVRFGGGARSRWPRNTSGFRAAGVARWVEGEAGWFLVMVRYLVDV